MLWCLGYTGTLVKIELTMNAVTSDYSWASDILITVYDKTTGSKIRCATNILNFVILTKIVDGIQVGGYDYVHATGSVAITSWPPQLDVSFSMNIFRFLILSLFRRRMMGIFLVTELSTLFQ